MTPRAAFDLGGLRAAVSGGNGGIGLGIAKALGAAGAAVAVWGRDGDKTAAAVSELVGEGVEAVGVHCDVAEEEDVRRSVAETVAGLGGLEICVANAGQSGHVRLVETTTETWEGLLRTNLTGTFLCFREAARHMLDAGRPGALVAVSSVASRHAGPLMHHYAASKAGVNALVRSVAVELAPHRIRCNALIPGFTQNARLTRDGIPPEMNAEVVPSIPARRWGTPADVGAAAVYLCDPSLSYHTGAELVVDGAYSVMPPYLAVRASRAEGPAC